MSELPVQDSDTHNETAQHEPSQPTRPLRREALLPVEQRYASTGVTAAFAIAGVASGLALATTLMAMQVAGNIASKRSYAYHGVAAYTAPAAAEHGYLGIRFSTVASGARVVDVFPGTPAARAGLQAGDMLESINGYPLANGAAGELPSLIWSMPSGAEVALVVERDGSHFVKHPALGRWPTTEPSPRRSHVLVCE